MKIILFIQLYFISFASIGLSDSTVIGRCENQIFQFINSTNYIQHKKDSLNKEYPPQGAIDIYGTAMTNENRYSYIFHSTPISDQWANSEENKNALIFSIYISLSYDYYIMLESLYFDLNNLTLWTAKVSGGLFEEGTVTYKKNKQILFDKAKLSKLKECLKN